MERVTAELRDGLIVGIRSEALHLELRDRYAARDHGRFRQWLAGKPFDPAAETEFWRPWTEMMGRHRAAGRTLRRLRVISEPVTDYIKVRVAGRARIGQARRGRPLAAAPAGIGAALSR